MAFLVLLSLASFICSLVWLVVRVFRKREKKLPLITIIASLILFVFSVNSMPKSQPSEQSKTSTSEHRDKKAVTKKSGSPAKDKKTKKEDRSEFFIIDNLIKDKNIGTEVMTIDDYEGFAINGFLLEGAIDKFGLPSQVIGSWEGDETIEVAYPSDEEGYSIGLIFEYKPSGFGDWKLKEKYAVKTDGISFSEYTKP